jgi:hypothetical protein
LRTTALKGCRENILKKFGPKNYFNKQCDLDLLFVSQRNCQRLLVGIEVKGILSYWKKLQLHFNAQKIPCKKFQKNKAFVTQQETFLL